MSDYYLVDGKKQSLERIAGTFLARVNDIGNLEAVVASLQAKGTIEHTLTFPDEGYLIISGATSTASLRDGLSFEDVSYITPAYKNPGSGDNPQLFVSNTILVEFTRPMADKELTDFTKQYGLELGRKSKYFSEFIVVDGDDNNVFSVCNAITLVTEVKVCQPNFVKIGGLH